LPLARVLLADAAMRMKAKDLGALARAADQLLRYQWPGNVRELETRWNAPSRSRAGRASSSRISPKRSGKHSRGPSAHRASCGRSDRD